MRGWKTMSSTVPDTGGAPVAQVGFAATLDRDMDEEGAALLYLDWLDWSGTPTTIFRKPSHANGKTWQRQWIAAVDHVYDWAHAFQIAQNHGRGLFMTGTRDWLDYRFSTSITPNLAKAYGVGFRVQGLRRYYALIIDREGIRLIRAYDGEETILASASFSWEFGQSIPFNVTVNGNDIRATVGDAELSASDSVLPNGGIALIVDEGRIGTDAVTVGPVS